MAVGEKGQNTGLPPVHSAPSVLTSTFHQEQTVWADRVEGVDGIDVVRCEGGVGSVWDTLPGQIVAAFKHGLSIARTADKVSEFVLTLPLWCQRDSFHLSHQQLVPERLRRSTS